MERKIRLAILSALIAEIDQTESYLWHYTQGFCRATETELIQKVSKGAFRLQLRYLYNKNILYLKNKRYGIH